MEKIALILCSNTLFYNPHRPNLDVHPDGRRTAFFDFQAFVRLVPDFFARTTNTRITRKPDNPLKGIRNPITQDPDNPLRVIWDLVKTEPVASGKEG